MNDFSKKEMDRFDHMLPAHDNELPRLTADNHCWPSKMWSKVTLSNMSIWLDPT